MIIHHDLQHARHFPDKRERTALLLTLLQQNLRLSLCIFFFLTIDIFQILLFFRRENVKKNQPQGEALILSTVTTR